MAERNWSHPADASGVTSELSPARAEVETTAPACEALEPRLMMRGGAPTGAYAQFIYQTAAAASFPGLTGKGESIAVIDTGISTKPSSLSGKVVAGWNFIDNNNRWQDTDGHGTAVAGVLAGKSFTYQGQRYQGIAPGAKLVALKVDDGVNDVPDARIAAALQWVLDHASQYNIVGVNISEGTGSFGGKISGPVYGGLLAQLAGRGIFVGAAAGNESDRSGVDYPGADVNAVSVGSTNLADQLSNFTNAGAALDILAPGESIVAPTLAGGRATVMTVAGTSFATPIIVGTAALIHQANPSFSTAQILDALWNTPFYDTDPIGGGTYARVDVYNSLFVALTSPGAARKFRGLFAR
jgi:subtilisin family serine protease